VLDTNWVKVSPILVCLEYILTVISLQLVLSAVGFFLIWGPRWAFGKLKNQPGIGIRGWPLLSVVLFVAIVLLFLYAFTSASANVIATVSWFSVSFFIITILFFVTACWSAFFLA